MVGPSLGESETTRAGEAGSPQRKAAGDSTQGAKALVAGLRREVRTSCGGHVCPRYRAEASLQARLTQGLVLQTRLTLCFP